MEISEIEDKIARQEMSAAQVFTQMMQHVSIPVNAPSKLTTLLCAAVEEAKDVYGEPKYKYYKKKITWSGRGRSRNHFTPIGDGTEVSESEYLDCIEESNRNQNAAFMGELKRSYLRYEKKMVVDGWREQLISTIKSI